MTEELTRIRKPKICVSGAAETSHCGMDAFEMGRLLGEEIAKNGAVLLIGATPGFPQWAAVGASDAGGLVIGFSGAENEEEHIEAYGEPTEYIKHVVYTGLGVNGCNIMLTRASDAVIVGCGRMGAINEFTVAYEEQKPIGVLKGPWKTDEIIENILEMSNLDSDKILIDNNPQNLVRNTITLATSLKEAEQKKKQSVINT